MNREDIFSEELNYFKEEKIRKATLEMINLLPEYFFEIPAASTGKYHPDYAQGKGGLLRHTKAAVRIGYELLSNPAIGSKYTEKEQDLMLMALLLHDGLKCGNPKEQYTRFDHPILMANYVLENTSKLGLEDEEIKLICDCIKTHMGYWTTDYNGEEILEKPKTKYQNFVHMCDFLASRKCLLVPFDKNNKISV